MSLNNDIIAALPGRLLQWYDANRREMPWRSAAGEFSDPYRVWLSEIMLQQTTVVTVGPYFEKFTARWPTLPDFAASDLDEVLQMWAGLGYYARARNLHKCAGVVVREFQGTFPNDEKLLLSLPGIGPYTAAAILSIAFDQRAVVVDGNVERVMSRLFAIEEPLPLSKPKLKSLADSLTLNHRPGDYAQAVMDLGATVCKPRKPLCSSCPWVDPCRANDLGIQEQLPKKTAKPPKPTRRGTAFWVMREDNKVLLRQRVPKGLLGGMMEIPSTPWLDINVEPARNEAPESHAPVSGKWQKEACDAIRHTFTHFHLEIDIWQVQVPLSAKLEDIADESRCRWVNTSDLEGEALPTLMRKIAASALKERLI